jgi:peptidoglycan/LPS O-acetylase OafA/YrhL
VLLVICFRLEGASYLDPGGSWPYAPMSLATAMLVLAATHLEGRALTALAPPALRALGVWSYGIFLYHQLALGAVTARLPFAAGEPSWSRAAVSAAAALAIAVAAGYASFRYLEAPIMRWMERRSMATYGLAIYRQASP